MRLKAVWLSLNGAAFNHERMETMRKLIGGLVAAGGLLAFATLAHAGGGMCDGMYTTSLDVATEDSAPMSTPADGATVATDTTIKPVVVDQSGG